MQLLEYIGLKTLLENVKMMVTSIFSFFHNALNRNCVAELKDTGKCLNIRLLEKEKMPNAIFSGVL